MEKIIFSLLLIISINTFASINFGCVTEYPTTSYIATTENGVTTFKFVHHNGVKYMPIWNSVITPNDLPVISEVGATLSELGDYWTLQMPEKSCSMTGMQLSCFGTQEPVDMNGHKVSLWATYTKEVTETSMAGNYSYIVTNLALDIDGKTFHVPMKYSDYECFRADDSKSMKKNLQEKKFL